MLPLPLLNKYMNSTLITCQSFLNVKFPETYDRKSLRIVLQEPRIILYGLILGKHLCLTYHMHNRQQGCRRKCGWGNNVSHRVLMLLALGFKHLFEPDDLSFRIKRKYWHGKHEGKPLCLSLPSLSC